MKWDRLTPSRWASAAKGEAVALDEGRVEPPRPEEHQVSPAANGSVASISILNSLPARPSGNLGGGLGDAARGPGNGAAIDHFDRPAHRLRCHIVEQHGIDPDRERLGELIERVTRF